MSNWLEPERVSSRNADVRFVDRGEVYLMVESLADHSENER